MIVTEVHVSFEKIVQFWSDLSVWHGLDTADLVSAANNRGDLDFDESALWESDPDLALEISDILDVESLLTLGGCLDAQ